MELSKERIRQLTNKLKNARTRLLVYNGFFGMLLMSMKFKLDDSTETIYTTVTHIGINPDFLGGCLDEELDFALMHEIMHLVLKHPFRGNIDDKNYNLAADIVVNSNILEASKGDTKAITLFGEEQPHTAPNGAEGSNFSVEEIYDMFDLIAGNCSDSDSDSSSRSSSNSKGKGGGGDDDYGDEDADDSGYDDYEDGDDDDHEGDQGGEGDEGTQDGDFDGKGGENPKEPSQGTFDDHSRWNSDKDKALQEALLNQKIMDAYEASKDRMAGCIPLYVERLIDEFTNPTIDWREVLNNFIQDEITDYSFVPPDYRMQDSPFIMPGFNDPDEKVEKILFMVDTSGSMSISDVQDCYSEIKGAIDQFDGKLKGYIGFFDADVKSVTPFDETTDLGEIKPVGGGGTDFGVIFDYVKKKMDDDLPVSIIVLTDGCADFPHEKKAMGIPVLWVINNKEVIPPWGKHVVLDRSKK